jgi:hypothetical protein
MSADDIRRSLDASRRAIQRDYAALRGELDFATKAKKAVVAHPLRWMGGAALFGYVLSGRKKQKARHRGSPGVEAETVKKITFLSVLLGVLRFLLPLAKPTLTAMATQKLAAYAGRFQR